MRLSACCARAFCLLLRSILADGVLMLESLDTCIAEELSYGEDPGECQDHKRESHQ